MQYLFVTLSPCGFIAAEYVLLGRMAKWLGGDRHLLIRPQRITLAFVLSDVTTFLIQVRFDINYCIGTTKVLRYASHASLNLDPDAVYTRADKCSIDLVFGVMPHSP